MIINRVQPSHNKIYSLRIRSRVAFNKQQLIIIIIIIIAKIIITIIRRKRANQIIAIVQIRIILQAVVKINLWKRHSLQKMFLPNVIKKNLFKIYLVSISLLFLLKTIRNNSHLGSTGKQRSARRAFKITNAKTIKAYTKYFLSSRQCRKQECPSFAISCSHWQDERRAKPDSSQYCTRYCTGDEQQQRLMATNDRTAATESQRKLLAHYSNSFSV